MDLDSEVELDFAPRFRLYKSGRVHRFAGTAVVPASPLDPATGVASRDVTLDPATGVSARLYRPNSNTKLPVLVYYHGGGFCIESAFSPLYHRFLNALASAANLLVVSVNYRLAPEHLLPAAYHDSWAALNWVFSPNADDWIIESGDLGRLLLGGDSAGANIVHHMVMRAANDMAAIKIEKLVLVHPYFWGSEPIGTEPKDPEARARPEKLWKVVNCPGVDIDDPRINFLARGAPDLQGLACQKVMVAVAGADLFAERGRAYVEALRGSGWVGEVELVETEGKGHVFHLKKPDCGEAAKLLDRIAGFLKKMN